jgi:hypothetical protein
MKKLVSMAAIAICILATPASSEFIFRYKSGIMPILLYPQLPGDPSAPLPDPSNPSDPDGPGTPSDPNDPNSPGSPGDASDPDDEPDPGNSSDPEGPIIPGDSQFDDSCVYEEDGIESKEGDWCEIYKYYPPFDGAPEPEFMVERIEPLRNADVDRFAYRCVRATGGWGHYSFYVSSTKLRGILSMDLIPHATPNIPGRQGVSDGAYPMSAPNIPGFIHVTDEQEFCLRLEVDDEEEEIAFEVEIFAEDWPDESVADGLADHNNYWSSSSVVARFGYNGGDDDPWCPYENCGPGSEEPESPETTVSIPCPEDLEDLVSPYSCISSEVSHPRATPDTTPQMTLEWLPTPAGSSSDYAYRCFRVGGGSGNYVINAEDKDISDWVGGVSIVPYEAPNISSTSNFYDIYPDMRFDEQWNYWTIATTDTDFCARVSADPAVSDRSSTTLEILVEDYHSDEVDGEKVNLDAARDSYIRALMTVDGQKFAN